MTGEQARSPSEYDLAVMLRRDEPQAAPASAWVEVYWHGQHVGRLERVDWLQLDPPDNFSTYWFKSLSGRTQIAGRDKDAVTQHLQERLAACTTASAVPQ